MTFQEFMLIQRELTKEYGLKENLEFAKLIYRKISHLKQLDDPTQAYQIACNVTERSLECILSHYINKSQNEALIQDLYKSVVGNVACDCSSSDYVNHLLSKVNLYHNYRTEKLAETLRKIVKHIK